MKFQSTEIFLAIFLFGTKKSLKSIILSRFKAKNSNTGKTLPLSPTDKVTRKGIDWVNWPTKVVIVSNP